jgi:hypothetical protein
MNLTQSQKKYASILGVCVAALAVDRLFLSPPDNAAAGSVTSSAALPANDAELIAEATRPSRTLEIPETTVASRFEDIATERGLDPTAVPDVFRAPAHWLPDEPTTEGPIIEDDPEGAERASKFLSSHRLNAVMAQGERGYAIIDGKRLQIGEALDGFRLREVHRRSVVLEDDGLEVTLELPSGGAP